MSRLDAVPQLLRWSEDGGALLDDLLQLKSRMLCDAIARDNWASTITGVCWSELSAAARQRLLAAPALCQAIRTGDGAMLRQCILADYVLDAAPSEHLDAWSATGDVWLGAHPPPADSDPAPLREVAGRYYGPRLDGGLALDCSLPAATAFPRGGAERPDYLSGPALDDAVARIESALRMIVEVAPAASAAVARLVVNLVLRSDPDRPMALQSATSAAAMGRVLLVNAHVPEVPVAELAEALVHESVHIAVSLAELDTPLALGEAARGDVVVASPWTGARLPLHAFLHACLVWFALLRFWLRAGTDSGAQTFAEMRCHDIRAGFRRLLDADVLQVRADLVPATVRDLLFSLRDEALVT